MSFKKVRRLVGIAYFSPRMTTLLTNIRNISLLCLLLSIVSCKPDVNSDQTTTKPGELPALEDDYVAAKNKWGFINKRGKVVIKPQFDDVRNFKDGPIKIGSDR